MHAVHMHLLICWPLFLRVLGRFSGFVVNALGLCLPFCICFWPRGALGPKWGLLGPWDPLTMDGAYEDDNLVFLSHSS